MVKKNITTNSLRSGNSTSCGCNHAPDLTNSHFNSLNIIKLDDSKKNQSKRYWLCKCVCGTFISVSTNQLRNNIITSCGCMLKYQITQLQTKCNIEEGLLLIKKQHILVQELNEELSKSIELLAQIRTQAKLQENS